MPIEVSRLETGILLQRISGNFSLNEMRQCQETGFALMKAAGDPKIVLVTDASRAGVPAADFSISGFKKLIENEDDYILQSIAVVTSPALRMGIAAFGRTVKAPIMLVATLENALFMARRLLTEATVVPSDMNTTP